MTDYDQPDVVTKRVRFFDGQYLQDQDFVDEQRFHLDRERRLARTLRLAGVLGGLAVSAVTGKPFTIGVAAGTAVDEFGRQLVLAQPGQLRLPADSFAKQQTVGVYLVYRAAEADIATTGGKSATRWDETPVIAAVTPGGATAVEPGDAPTQWDSAGVLLARVSISDSGAVGVIEGPARAGLSVPGNLAAGGRFDLGGDLTTTGNLGVGTTAPENAEQWARVLDVFGGQNNAKLSVRAAGIDARVMAHPGFWGAQNGMVVGTGTAHALTLGTAGAARLSIGADGNVGIGTPVAQRLAGMDRVVDVIGATGTLLALGTGTVKARISVQEAAGSWSSFGGLSIGTTTNHPLVLATNANAAVVLDTNGDLLVGSRTSGNDEGWQSYSEVYAALSATTAARTGSVDARVAAHELGFYGAQPGMIVGPRTAHPVTFMTGQQPRLSITPEGHVQIGPRAGGKYDNSRDKWSLAVTAYSDTSTLVAVQTSRVDGRVIAADAGYWGALGGLVIGTNTGHAVTVAAGGKPTIIADPNGNVGIGTGATRPGYKLQVTGAGGVNVDLVVNGRIRSDNNEGGLWVQSDRFVGGYGDVNLGFWNNNLWAFTVDKNANVVVGQTTVENVESWNRVLDVHSQSSTKLSVRTAGIDARVAAHSTGIYGAPAGMVVGTKTGHPVSFVTGATNRMTLNGDGSLYLGGTGNWWNARMTIEANEHHLVLQRPWPNPPALTNPRQVFLELYQYDVDPPAGPAIPELQPSIRFHHRNRHWLRIESHNSGFHFKTGDNTRDDYVRISAASFNQPSDARLKEEVTELDGALGIVERLRGVGFRWKRGPQVSPEQVGTADIGLIAQEAEAVLPTLVHTGTAGYKSMDYAKLTAVLVQAVKEQQQSIRTLQGRLAALETT